MICSYCEEEVDKITEKPGGSYCDSCIEEIVATLGEIGDTAFYTNKYFSCFLNKDFIRFGFGVSIDG